MDNHTKMTTTPDPSALQRLIAEMRQAAIFLESPRVKLLPSKVREWADQLDALLVPAHDCEQWRMEGICCRECNPIAREIGPFTPIEEQLRQQLADALLVRRDDGAIREAFEEGFALSKFNGSISAAWERSEARQAAALSDPVVRPAREWQQTREGEAACLDCGLPYSAFPLDVNLPRAQWLDIHPDDGGLLCAACIVQRVKDRIPGVTVLHMVAEVTPAHQHDRSCRVNSWLNDGPCTCGKQLTPAPPGLAREGLDKKEQELETRAGEPETKGTI